MPSYKNRKQSRRNKRSKGGDASNWAKEIYGDRHAQVAASPNSNVIKMNDGSNLNLDKMQTGGLDLSKYARTTTVKQLEPEEATEGTTGGRGAPHNLRPSPTYAKINNAWRRGGRGILTDVAVPAVLLYANNMVKSKKRSTKRKYRRYNKSRKNK